MQVKATLVEVQVRVLGPQVTHVLTVELVVTLFVTILKKPREVH